MMATRTPTRFFAAGVALLAALAVEAAKPLCALAPGHAAIALGADVAGLRRHPEFRRALADERIAGALEKIAGRFGCSVEDLGEIFVIQDSRGRRSAALVRFSDPARPEFLLRRNASILKSEGGNPELYRIFGVDRRVDDYRVALIAPGVAAFYSPPRNGVKPAVDRSGLSEEMRQLLPDDKGALLYAAGMPKLIDELFRSVEEFAGVLAPHAGQPGKLEFRGYVGCRDEMSAAVLRFSLTAAISYFLQRECGLSPEQAGQRLKALRIRQDGSQLLFSLSEPEKWIRPLLDAPAPTFPTTAKKPVGRR